MLNKNIMSQFTLIGKTYFRQDDSGQLFPVTDRETLTGLDSGQLPYNAVPNTKALTFAESKQEVSGKQTSTLSSSEPTDIASLIKSRLISSLSNLKGVSNVSDLEERRQALLKQSMLSSPGKYAPGGDVSSLGASGALSALKESGSEFTPAIRALELQINQAKQGDNDAMNNVLKLVSLAKDIGVFGGEKRDTSLTEVDGQRVLVDNQTGEIVKVLGSSEAGGTGKKVKIPSTTVTNLTEGRTLPSVLDSLEKLINDNKSKFGIISGANVPFSNKTFAGAASDKIKDDMSRAAQLVGKFLEGGKLAEGDINRYREMLPSLNDRNYTVSIDKLNGVRQLLQSYYNNSIEDLEGSGYDTSGFSPIEFGSGSKKETKVIKGVTYVKVEGGWQKQ